MLKLSPFGVEWMKKIAVVGEAFFSGATSKSPESPRQSCALSKFVAINWLKQP